jgi:hypothetical protein
LPKPLTGLSENTDLVLAFNRSEIMRLIDEQLEYHVAREEQAEVRSKWLV